MTENPNSPPSNPNDEMEKPSPFSFSQMRPKVPDDLPIFEYEQEKLPDDYSEWSQPVLPSAEEPPPMDLELPDMAEELAVIEAKQQQNRQTEEPQNFVRVDLDDEEFISSRLPPELTDESPFVVESSATLQDNKDVPAPNPTMYASVQSEPYLSPEENDYLTQRWQAQQTKFQRQATTFRRYTQLLNVITGVGAILLPLLIALLYFGEETQILFIAAITLSLFVAVAFLLNNLGGYRKKADQAQQIADDLIQEKNLYNAEAGLYAGNSERFTTFVERCEDIIAQKNVHESSSIISRQFHAERQIQELFEQFQEDIKG